MLKYFFFVIFKKEVTDMCTIWIVDSANFYGILKKILPYHIHMRNVRIDFNKMVKILTKDYKEDKIYKYFVGNRPKTYTTKKLYDSLEENNFELIVPDNPIESKSEWDDWMIRSRLQSYITNPKINNIFLISGDGGFIKELKKLSANGKKIFIVGFYDNMSNLYIHNDQFTFYDLRNIYKQIISFPGCASLDLKKIRS